MHSRPARRTGRPAPTPGAGLHDLVLAAASREPSAPAVTVAGVSMSFGELVGAAEQLADELRRAGVSAGDFVGVAADRTAETIVGLLGVLIAGAAYVPVPVDLPADRMRVIAEEADLRVVVTGQDGRLAEHTGAVRVPVARAAGGPPLLSGVGRPSPGPDRPAYAIFTSGSTGRPKGVVVDHRAAVASTLTRFDVYPHDAVTYLMLAPLSIDAAVAGLYFTLSCGGRLVLPTAEESLDPELLSELVLREGVTHLDGLPSQYASLLRFHSAALRDVRCVVLGGEYLPHPLLREHLAAGLDAELFNEYGPTEGTVWSTVHRCTEEDAGPLVPIGAPIAGVRARVLTDTLAHAAPGTVGEIYLGGAGLAQGYLGRPGRTAERFVADPDPHFPGQRMYRTGDLGELTAEGELIYHGREDQLVKVRGFRVELAEIEARLLEHAGVVEAAVVPHAGPTGLRLVAVVASAAPEAPGARALAVFMRERLPGYMVPALWRRVDALPVTANGKVDRTLLTSLATTVGTALPV
ncbi:amino acid adenylation domain-containing protein [Streptomyces sp. rh34]|uniref:amino acid adenylation domain-containing protein n=1 Tax=Streptomyces sp. rh34 TaxID=2034272 RepID=UPI0015CF083D|nr:amino acid adenylation domain-containing protein [Streptomyces sp. rh34]